VGRARSHAGVGLVSALDATTARRWVDAFLDAVAEQRSALGDLDRQSGDGDFGTNMETSVRAARAALESAPPGVGPTFSALSNAFLATGGTSGPLYGMLFRQLGGLEDGATAADVARAIENGTDMIRKLGGAAPGDKTLVDALAPARVALSGAAHEGADVWKALAAAAVAARAGAEATAAMVARRGRASYVGEVARGVLDPGAVVVALFFEAAASAGG